MDDEQKIADLEAKLAEALEALKKAKRFLGDKPPEWTPKTDWARETLGDAIRSIGESDA